MTNCRVFGERQIMASQLALLIGGIATVLVHKGASAGSGFSFFFLLIMGMPTDRITEIQHE